MRESAFFFWGRACSRAQMMCMYACVVAIGQSWTSLGVSGGMVYTTGTLGKGLAWSLRNYGLEA